jgi:ABC-type multidrug transport system fused ATPase/permease subunit
LISRVSLARAVYSNAKTVLLDDVLSSIDSHTSKHIYKKCLLGDLLQGRTVILVTHQVRLCLPGAKFLVKIENGQVLGCDTIDNLRSSGQLPRLLGNEHQNEDDGETEEDIEEDANTGDVYDGIDLDNKAEAAKLVKEETSEKGQVKLKVYLTYLAACGGWFFWISLILTYVFARLMTFGENWWLRIWAAASETDTNSALSALSADYNPQFLLMTTKTKTVYGVFDTLGAAIQKQNIFKSWVFEEKAPINVDFYIGVYIAICFGYIVTDVFRNVLVYWGSIRGARTLFDSLLDRIIHAPMRFFDTTPVGRILNRFGKDVSTIDLDIARSASFLIECVTAIIASTIVISMITPQFLLVAIVISKLHI